MIEQWVALSGFNILGVAIVLPRIALAFIILPLFGKDTIPALVRNSLLVCFAIVLLPLSQVPAQDFFSSGTDWFFLLLKEAFVGLCIGFVFSSIFWALNIAGGVIDTQTGSNMANTVDPVMGHQSALISNFFARFAAVLFMVSGAFLVFMDVLLSSFQVWPVDQMLPLSQPVGVEFFNNQFGFIMTKAILFASPVMVVLFIIDMALGLINRFAQHMNFLSIATPVKAMLSVLILILSLGTVAESVLHQVVTQSGLLDQLQPLWTKP